MPKVKNYEISKESTQEDGAQFEHPNIMEYTTFPQYVWKGDTLEDVLKDFTAGVQHATMASIMGEIQSQMSKQKYLTNNKSR